MDKIWELKPEKFENIIQQLLFNRGINSDIKSFLDPDFDKDFFDSKLLPDFEVAMKRLSQSLDKKEKIGIYADYDADGIPGAALLYKVISLFGVEPSIYIPARSDGYGFNRQGIDYLINGGCKLIVSVDLGIREVENSKYIKDKNIDLIITDHHEPGENLPHALAIVNPKRSGSKYPFRELCGAGVIFKVAQGLSKIYPKIIDEKFLKWNLDLVAISTISDVVPLISENRVIAKFGLKVLGKTKNVGLQELFKVANIDQNKIDAYAVGFQIGPRINAPGRIDNATQSFNLLVTADKNQAYQDALHLQSQNELRQRQMEEIFDSASKIIEANNLTKEKIIIISHKDWQKGVIGPVASRLVEKYNRPVIIFSEKDDSLEGSCRSIGSFDVTQALESTKKYLSGFGGHSGAAGVQLQKKNLNNFKESVTNYAKKNIGADDLNPKIVIDLDLPAKKISVNLFKELDKLEPFGMGNPKPVFITRKLKLLSHRLVGKDSKHLQLRFTDGLTEYKAVVFNHNLELDNLPLGKYYDIVYQPGVNFWNGKNWIDLRILDIRSRTDDELSNN